MTSQRWQGELEQIAEALADVADVVPLDLRAAVEALLNSDVEAAARLVERSRAVDRRTDMVEAAAQRLILLQQPTGPDFRLLMALLRITASIDRASRLAAHVAELARTMTPALLPDPIVEQIRSVSEDVAELYQMSVTAFRNGDAATAALADERDDHVDAGCRDLRATVVAEFTDRAGRAETLMDLGLLCRYLERIGDHAVALADDTVYAVSGETPEGPVTGSRL